MTPHRRQSRRSVQAVLKLIPGLEAPVIESSCCGMASALGYGAETCDVSIAMAELSRLPAVRKAKHETIIVADGTFLSPPDHRRRRPSRLPCRASWP
jgi:hypothetical protein